jgi:uncharacterized protein YukE
MFGIDDVLLRLARQVLESVLSQLMQQLNVVEEEALSPMRRMIETVTGGMWIGKGADAFVEEVSTMMIPGVGRVSQTISTLNKNIQHARDVVERADEEVDRLIKSRVFDAFEFF